MIQLILHLYIFLAWTGSWSSHSGMGTVIFACLWIVALGLGLICAFFAPSIVTVVISLIVRMGFGKEAGRVAMNIADGIDLVINGLTFMVPILGVAGGALICYFTGMDENLFRDYPRLFPRGGYLFSDASIPWYAYMAPLYLAWTYYSMLFRFGITDDIQASMSASKKFAKEFRKRTVVVWKCYSPVVKSKGGMMLAATMRQGGAFALLSVGLMLHGGMLLGLIAFSRVISRCGNDTNVSESNAMLVAMRRSIDNHKSSLRLWWKDGRNFTISFCVIVVLLFLMVIF